MNLKRNPSHYHLIQKQRNITGDKGEGKVQEVWLVHLMKSLAKFRKKGILLM